MNPNEILELTLKDGVVISANGVEKIKVEGDRAAVETWLPMITEHKQVLLRLLKSENGSSTITPAPCLNCSKLEVINIMGADVPGCLYKVADSEWSEGWQRLPKDLEECVRR